jgi:hypothetical protein
MNASTETELLQLHLDVEFMKNPVEVKRLVEVNLQRSEVLATNVVVQDIIHLIVMLQRM